MAKQKQVQDIDAIFNMDDFSQTYTKPEDWENTVLILHDVVQKAGQKGDYLVMTCQVETTGETVYVSTGANQVMAFCKAWLNRNKQPVRFSFYKTGDRILMDRPVHPVIGQGFDMSGEVEPDS